MPTACHAPAAGGFKKNGPSGRRAEAVFDIRAERGYDQISPAGALEGGSKELSLLKIHSLIRARLSGSRPSGRINSGSGLNLGGACSDLLMPGDCNVRTNASAAKHHSARRRCAFLQAVHFLIEKE
jgi:hypothetical protein